MEPDVVCANALLASISETRTIIGLKYLIPSPFLAVCVLAPPKRGSAKRVWRKTRIFVGLNLQIRGKVCQAKLPHLTGKVALLYRYSDSFEIQRSGCRTTKFRITSSTVGSASSIGHKSMYAGRSSTSPANSRLEWRTGQFSWD